MAPKETRPRNLRVHLRGNRFTLGRVVPRGFLRVISPQTPHIAAGHSGRLELARWIADKTNPLTARVMVNRIWQHHFGRGLVATTDNFGVRGERPSHPELLDWLATRFVESGWSVKAMHRLMVLSDAYRRTRGPPISRDKAPRRRRTRTIGSCRISLAAGYRPRSCAMRCLRSADASIERRAATSRG